MAAIYRRGKTYWARAQRQGRDRRVSLKTANRAIAEKRLRTWLEELDAIAWGDKPRRSWEEAVAKFIREHPTGKFYACKRGHAFAVVDGKISDNTPSTALVVRAWEFK